MRVSKVAPYRGEAEGTFCGVPYNTELGLQGCDVHFWLGGIPAADRERRLDDAVRAARNIHDVVYCTWSENEPEGFWAHGHYDIDGLACPPPETAAS